MGTPLGEMKDAGAAGENGYRLSVAAFVMEDSKKQRTGYRPDSVITVPRSMREGGTGVLSPFLWTAKTSVVGVHGRIRRGPRISDFKSVKCVKFLDRLTNKVFHVYVPFPPPHLSSGGAADRMRGEAMDFIEKIFGVSPDAGSGTLEAALVVAATVVAALATVMRNRARAAQRGR
jgi:hypothetical protein